MERDFLVGAFQGNRFTDLRQAGRDNDFVAARGKVRNREGAVRACISGKDDLSIFTILNFNTGIFDRLAAGIADQSAEGAVVYHFAGEHGWRHSPAHSGRISDGAGAAVYTHLSKGAANKHHKNQKGTYDG